MALSKKLVLSQLTILENGTALIQLDKVIEEDGVEISRQHHRTSVEPGADVDAVLTGVLADLDTPEHGRFAVISPADLTKAKALTRAAHTAAVVKAFRDRPRKPGP